MMTTTPVSPFFGIGEGGSPNPPHHLKENFYHRVNYNDCLQVATASERDKLQYITPMELMKELAERWCAQKGYNLGGYLGSWCWDATLRREDGKQDI